MWAINNAVADLNRKVMPTSVALVLIDAIEQEGIDISQLRQSFNLEESRLLDSNELLAPIEVQLFILRALQHHEDKPVSFRFGRQLGVNLMGDLGQVMMAAQTLGEALHDLSQYVKAFNYLVGYDVEETADTFTLVPQLGVYACGPEYNLRFAMETALTSCLSILKFLAGETIHPQSVSFTYQPPFYKQKYQELFGDNVCFSSDCNAVVYSQKDLAKKVVTGNSVIHKLFKKRCEEKLKQVAGRQTIESLAKRYLNSHETLPGFEQLAQGLGLTSSALRRKFVAANTSYQMIVDDVRKERAEKLLRQPRVSVEYIALQLGFADASNFRRAFKRWTGATPSDYRKQYA